MPKNNDKLICYILFVDFPFILYLFINFIQKVSPQREGCYVTT